jgi:hypothetical protein
MLPIDPWAERSRRAWVACPNCDDARDCHRCRERLTCAEHWRYILGFRGSVLRLQCPGCAHLWEHETGFGATRGRTGPASGAAF